MLKNKIQNYVQMVHGKVTKSEEQHYSSGGDYQDIWYTTPEGNENFVQLTRRHVAVRENHEIAVISGLKRSSGKQGTNKVYRLINKTTGYYWRLDNHSAQKTIFHRFFTFVFEFILSIIIALIACLPFVNLLWLFTFIKQKFVALFRFDQDDFKKCRRFIPLFHLIIIACLAVGYSPYLVKFYPQYAPPQTITIEGYQANTVKNICEFLAINVQQNQQQFTLQLYKTQVNIDGTSVAFNNGYMHLSCVLLFFIWFLFLNYSTYKEYTIQKALDYLAQQQLKQ